LKNIFSSFIDIVSLVHCGVIKAKNSVKLFGMLAGVNVVTVSYSKNVA